MGSVYTMNGRTTKQVLATVSFLLLITGMMGLYIVQMDSEDQSIAVQDLAFSDASGPAELWNSTLSTIHMQFGTMDAFSWSGCAGPITGFFALALGTVATDRRERTSGKLRDRVVSEITDQPGIHLRELKRTVDCAMGALQYHLRNLEEEHVVESHKSGNTKHFFVSDFSSDTDVLHLASVLRNPTARLILEEILKVGRTTQAELSRSLGLDKSLVSYYVSSLLEDGILKAIRVFGREKPLVLTDWAVAEIPALLSVIQ
ncbi:winged helix-turn-helix transcriptional regulator [Candidatus Thorarchaeota archaeon]|nr:MAG: winged helix-turn-helix transcriptional regulator [Candidatus Thorarchaeota archaeon]